MFSNRYVNLGSASASVSIDLSQAQASVATMRSIAQQIAQSVTTANQSIASLQQQPAQAQGGGAGASPYGMSPQQLAQINQQAQQFSQSQAAAQQQVTQAVQATAQARNQNISAFEKEFALANAMVGVIRTQVAEQANLYRTATANAPATVDRSGVEQQLRAARQPIVELQAQLAQLRSQYLQATTPEARAALIPELQRIQQAAQQAANGMQPLVTAVRDFSQQVVASRSGVEGYFNSVRENLEKINETSLAANLQEISFRLLPLGIAAAGLTKQGLETAEAIQESAISFSAFTGSQEKARQLMGELTDQAHKFGQPMIETLTTMQRFAPIIRNAGLQLDDVYNLAVRLSTLNPTQGIEGSLYALNEAVAGQWRSIQTRFNLPTKELKEFIDQFGFTEGFDKFLNKIGRTTEFAQQFGQTTRASFTRMQDSINNFLSTSLDKFLGGMQSGADATTNFFNSLAEGNSILTTLTGGVLLLTSTLTTGLITLGQFALAWSSISAVVKPLELGSRLLDILPSGIQNAFIAAAPAVVSILQTAVAAAVRAGLLAGTVAGGVFVGTNVAAAFGVGGTHDPQEEQNRLNQIIFTAIAAISEPFFIGAEIIKSGIDAIGTAIQLIASSIQLGVKNLEIKINEVLGQDTTELQGQLNSRFVVTNPNQPTYTYRATGSTLDPKTGLPSDQTGQDLAALIQSQSAYGSTITFIEGYTERITRLNDQLKNPPDTTKIVEAGVANAHTFLNGLLQLMFNIKPEQAAGGNTGLSGGAPPIDQQALDDALKVINQIAVAERDYALQQKRTLEDRALAAAREAEDVALANQRRAADFTLQQTRASEDYYRNRQQSIDDFNRQTVEAQKQADEQRAKMQSDYNTQSLRAEQDHLRDMIRLSRDITDAISARDFLAAQKTIQRMQDQEADYQTEKARRDEDFQKQLADLQENLTKQQDKRKEDFERQLALQDANFNLQRQRQIADYNRQAQLAEQDRQLRLARQAQDFVIQQRRREEDFNRQIQDMVSNNAILRGIWNNGLENLLALTRGFFMVQLPAIFSSGFTSISNLGNSIGSIIGGILGTSGAGTSDLGTGTLFPNVGTAFSQDASWFTPATMRLSGGNAALPGGIVSGGRQSAPITSPNSGNVYQVTVPLQVINGAGLDENQLVERAEKRIVPKMIEALEQQARTTQPRRGFN